MGKTIVIFRANDGNPILDSISVTATQTFTPYTVYSGTIIGSGNNNGSRFFSNCIDGDYNIKYDGSLQSDLNPLFIPGPGGTVQATIGQTSITSNDIQDGAIGTLQLADSAVTTDKITNNAVTAAKINAGAVDGTSLADESVIKSKLGTSIFNLSMEDDSGWGVNYDNTTIKYAAGTGIYIAALGVDTAQIADDSLSTAKYQDRSITAIKLGTASITGNEIGIGAVDTEHIANEAVETEQLGADSVTQAKIYAGAVGTTELADVSITSAKIADQNVTADKLVDASIPIGKLSTSLANSMLRFASKIVYVSPEYSDNVSPYFDNIADAYADVGSDQGTILLYPGTYTTQITMAESVNIIGVDKLRCIIEIDPPAATPYGIKLTATSKDVLFKDFTLKVESSTVLGATTYGIWLDSPGSNWVRMENLLIKVQTAANVVGDSDKSIGFYINEANFVLQNSLVESYGGNYGAGTGGGDVDGIYLIGTTVGTIFNSQFAIRNQATSGDFTQGIYWTNTNQDVIVDNCTIETTDDGVSPGTEYAFAAGTTVTVVVMGTLYSKTKDANVTLTSGLNNTLSSDVVVRGTI